MEFKRNTRKRLELQRDLFVNTSLDLGLDLFDRRAGRGCRRAPQEGVDRFHRSVFHRIRGTPIDGNAARFHRIFQIVGRFRLRCCLLLEMVEAGFVVNLLDNAVILGNGGRVGADQSVLFEIPLGYVVDRDGNVTAAHLVDPELGSFHSGSRLWLVLLAKTAFIGGLLLFDDRLPNGNGFRSVRARFGGFGCFSNDHLGALGDFGCRGGAAAGSHFLSGRRWRF